MPSGTWIIPRIFPQGRVIDCHYKKAITNWARNTLLRAGPVTMGRIPLRRRPSSCGEEDGGWATPSSCFRWCSEVTKAWSEG
jgi:hypothetical protein